MNWVNISIGFQTLLAGYFFAVHSISVYPWNDLSVKTFKCESVVNFIWSLVQLISIYGFVTSSHALIILGFLFWTLWTYGHTLAWWVPYFKGASREDMEDYNRIFGRTHKFLPAIADHPIPDSCHTVLGALTYLTYLCTAIATAQTFL